MTFYACPACCQNGSTAKNDMYDPKLHAGESPLSEEAVGAKGRETPSAPAAVKARADKSVELPEKEVEHGAKYKGQWKGNVRHGVGILTRADGQTYEGAFVEGQAHGKGKLVASNGNMYDGEWDMDRAHGQGIYRHVDGSTYEGQWRADEKSGRGKESWADGAQYEGEFFNGC
jgi:hypothetical protein